MSQHPTTTHTSYVCNALGWYTIGYPRCHLYFLRIHTVFKLIVHIFEGNTGDLCVISCYNNNFVAIFVFFGTASSFTGIISFLEIQSKLEAILFLFGCSEVNSTWIITSGLANQRAPKALFTCVAYTNNYYCIS